MCRIVIFFFLLHYTAPVVSRVCPFMLLEVKSPTNDVMFCFTYDMNIIDDKVSVSFLYGL